MTIARGLMAGQDVNSQLPVGWSGHTDERGARAALHDDDHWALEISRPTIDDCFVLPRLVATPAGGAHRGDLDLRCRGFLTNRLGAWRIMFIAIMIELSQCKLARELTRC